MKVVSIENNKKNIIYRKSPKIKKKDMKKLRIQNRTSSHLNWNGKIYLLFRKLFEKVCKVFKNKREDQKIVLEKMQLE